jgi:hypothetical protein
MGKGNARIGTRLRGAENSGDQGDVHPHRSRPIAGGGGEGATLLQSVLCLKGEVDVTAAAGCDLLERKRSSAVPCGPGLARVPR